MTKLLKKSLLAIFLLIFPEKKEKKIPAPKMYRADAVSQMFSCNQKR